MKKFWAAAAAAMVALTAAATSSQASFLALPGETAGLAYGAPLPEGVFAVDLESYGRSDGVNAGVGVNIPVIVWSTPFTFYDTRLEFLYAAPFIHRDGGGVNRVDFYSEAFGPILAHSFGNGFNVAVSGFVRTPDVVFHDYTGADMRLGLSYVANGFDLSATFYYTGTFGGRQGVNGQFLGGQPLFGFTGASDAVNVDFTATKKFGKIEAGLVGFATTDINTRADNVGFYVGPNGTIQTFDKRAGRVAVGGLIGYDFGRFTLQGYVTREVAKRFAYNGSDAFGNAGYGERETRGFIRLVVPLYVAPAPPLAPIRARY